MINPFKNSEGINNFFVSLEGNLPLTSSDKPERKSCQPDMDWIYNKCMMQSKEYRELRESFNTAHFRVHPLTAKIPELRNYNKKRMKNSYDYVNGFDHSVENPVFMSCALAYQEHCKKFYERKAIEEKFQLD